MKNYLVGDSIAPADDIDEDEEVLCSQSLMIDSKESNKGKRVQRQCVIQNENK